VFLTQIALKLSARCIKLKYHAFISPSTVLVCLLPSTYLVHLATQNASVTLHVSFTSPCAYVPHARSLQGPRQAPPSAASKSAHVGTSPSSATDRLYICGLLCSLMSAITLLTRYSLIRIDYETTSTINSSSSPTTCPPTTVSQPLRREERARTPSHRSQHYQPNS
jgi:hypothetical protein